ncbi:MAG: hypothetical protein A2504_12900 [Bdellovibrionales bacterium RIFOXYD12_FULL_39_22]|nr:MAG: hypothetical protein A2385_11965 [Bdellovibrionales bacterium RIFOXYB1_FULL_39_21]OFZ48940.1 MAG: hypothetical protein A2404_14175 [Bdellovibrionales bacterium RIFOXYC1_FULL_39_130]OFZ77638.1 MAG: hypothetical protein A2560_04745 [Bdellovibrionales bacterium RIFOXYD1_FULL_39_84]OFZ96092.1 MAG: hypothetical protein A2504_12900 [Bdellovibrionales bacterium RIFOXYD12_FULL_39_22]HLE11631.1 ABC transporter ATP-binding protein [Bacteriovoracaceae bacterium]
MLFLKTMRWFFPLWARHKKAMFFIFLLSAITISVETIGPIFLKTIFDSFEKDYSLDSTQKLIWGFAIFSFFRIFVTQLLPFSRGFMNLLFSAIMRGQFYKIYTESNRQFFEKFSTGDLLTRLTDDIDGGNDRLAWYACSGILRPFEAFFTILFPLIIMFNTSAPLTLASFLPIPFLVAILAHFELKMLRLISEKQQAASDCNQVLESCFSGIRVVKSTLSEAAQLAKYQELTNRRTQKEKEFLKVNQTIQLFSILANSSGPIITIFLGSYMMIAHTISLGDFLMFIVYLNRMMGPIWTLSWFYATTKQVAKYEQRLDETAQYLLTQNRSKNATQNSTDNTESTKTITKNITSFESMQFKNVSFSYTSQGRPIISNFNLSIKKGEKVAIMGKVGSGKSTLLSLADGTLRPSSGEVLINGLSTEEINSESLYNLVATIPQESILFSDSIKDNILLGANYSDEKIAQAIDHAMMKEDLDSFPDKEKTILLQKGVSLSGGQRQRISIARTLIRRPELILMDDITAAMDAKTEELFWKKIKENYPETTMIITTHRTKTAMAADRVINYLRYY